MQHHEIQAVVPGYQREPEAGGASAARLCSSESRSRNRKHVENSGDCTSTALEGRTFLVVEDDAGIRTALAELLAWAGASVVSAPDGAGAARELEQHASAIDLVLLDLTLPDQRPQAVVERLRHLVPGIPILISSGCDQADATELCTRLEAAGFLAKPYRFQQLVSALRSALGTSPV